MNAMLLMPDSQLLHLDYFQLVRKKVFLGLSITASQQICPDCSTPSKRVHSHYIRKLSDLPWSEKMVIINLEVRRFFCDNSQCRRCTFVEQLPDIIAPYAWRTLRLAETLQAIGFALGGEPGARLIGRLHMPASPDTLLRIVRSLASPGYEPPSIVGVDDWAIRKGVSYGTILVDLERHRPIDLLPDRSSDTLMKWLQRYPNIKIVTRDRANGYLEGVSKGAPQAMQIADRWYLLKNLGDTVEKVMTRCHQKLVEATKNADPVEGDNPSSLEETPKPEPNLATREQQKRTEGYERRKSLYEEVKALHSQGVSTEKLVSN